jgi:predicted transglutaminase-like cysteine proteinase
MMIMGCALSAAACANLPEASTPMPLGAAATPPRGYVSFCEREPGDCGASAPELAAMRTAAYAAPRTPAVAAISYDWSAVFPQRSPASAATASLETRGFDWSPVFAKPKAANASAPAAPLRATGPKSPTLTMNHAAWALLTQVNTAVNTNIRPQEDVTTYGVSDYWTTPLEGGVPYGDCEDYVLEKRHELTAAGVPAQALSISVVLTEKGETHAVLVVATSTGDYVLDNRTPWILPWTQAAYRWRERQVAGSASHWAYVSAASAPAPHAPLLLASAR